MKQLFLSSSFADVADIFGDAIGASCEGKSVTFIPTASIHDKVTFYVKAGVRALEKLGMRVDMLEISTASNDEIAAKLQSHDFIYISGGNTFFLLQELKRSGANVLLKNHINAGKYFIGESAGSMIASPNIEYAKIMDDWKKAPNLQDYDALHLVDFYPVPHYTNFPFKKAVEKIIVQYNKKLPLYPISNSQAIIVHGDAIEVVPAK